MAREDNMKVKLTLTVQELDSLDDLLELYLDNEWKPRKLNRVVLAGVRDNIGRLMEIISLRLGFDAERKNDKPKYLM
jgi:hypothetical protein|tara:strand:+ start:161 stop:391 length:231 start_codon:yes stop_codon:yes gene_type:complete